VSPDPVALGDVRAQFPALAGGLVELDNAATTHKPLAVLDALRRHDVESNANVHRATHRRARAATEAYEGARAAVARFLAAEPREVVFTRNATEAINLVARGWAQPRLAAGDRVVVTALEHHSNLVPWQQVCRRTGAELVVLPCDARGRVAVPRELPPRSKLVASTRVSNALGTIVDTEALVRLAHASGAAVLLDLAQAAAHLPLDAGSRDADFVVLSAHKLYGPTGIGVLRGRVARLLETEPVNFGGEMVSDVQPDAASWQAPPLRFEAGTPPIAQAAGLAAAVEFVEGVGVATIREHELSLLTRLIEGLARVDGVRVAGPPTAAERSGAVSVVIDGGDVQTAAAVLDMAGIAVRAGWHCAQPLLQRHLACGPTLRASVAVYSSREDVDRFLAALPEAVAASR
jgi:cysteine desulfurase/selenocysteine lyase